MRLKPHARLAYGGPFLAEQIGVDCRAHSAGWRADLSSFAVCCSPRTDSSVTVVSRPRFLCCLLPRHLVPRPWHEFVDAAVWPSFCYLLHDIRDVGKWLDAVQFAAFDDGVDGGGAFAASP